MGTNLPPPDVPPKSEPHQASNQEIDARGEAEAKGDAGDLLKTVAEEQQVTVEPKSAAASLVSKVQTIKHDNGRVDAQQFFALGDRFPLQVFSEETNLQKLAHWGPLVMGVASIVLTIFVWRNTEKLSSQQVALQAKQVELQDRQNQVQNHQAEAQLADLRFKYLNDLTATDENKRTPAEIGLAAHGLEAFPVVHYALGVEPGDIRNSAVNVVYRLFQAEKDEGREQLLSHLRDEFAFPNRNLHTGVVQSLVKLELLLNPEQRKTAIGFLQEKLAPQSVCTTQEGREAVLEAAKFVGSKHADAIPYLTSVIGVPACGDGWLQGMYNFENLAPKLSVDERSLLREKVSEIKKDVLAGLEQKINRQELGEGAGYAGFLNKGEVTVQFEVFKTRIEKEFDTLISQLG